MIKHDDICRNCPFIENCQIAPRYYEQECPCGTCLVKIKCKESKKVWGGCRRKHQYLLYYMIHDGTNSEGEFIVFHNWRLKQ